jgi:hypothetical protein
MNRVSWTHYGVFSLSALPESERAMLGRATFVWVLSVQVKVILVTLLKNPK